MCTLCPRRRGRKPRSMNGEEVREQLSPGRLDREVIAEKMSARPLGAGEGDPSMGSRKSTGLWDDGWVQCADTPTWVMCVVLIKN